jgi:hypothetical protein
MLSSPWRDPPWIKPGDDRFEDDLALKASMLDGPARDQLLISDNHPATLLAACEALELILSNCDMYPNFYSRCCEMEGLRIVPSGQFFGVGEWKGRELELAARLIREDLIILKPGREEHELAAACVVFSFGLSGKLGWPLTRLHGPVPGYVSSLGASTERVLQRLEPEAGIARSNWELRTSGEMVYPGVLDPSRRGQVGVASVRNRSPQLLRRECGVVWCVVVKLVLTWCYWLGWLCAFV